MAELKTKKTTVSAEKLIALAPAALRDDAKVLISIMQRVTGAPATVWGTSMIGFGDYHYLYESGREGDWFEIGFAIRKTHLTIYHMCGGDFVKHIDETLGKYKMSGSCLHIKKLADINVHKLEQLLSHAVKSLRTPKK